MATNATRPRIQAPPDDGVRLTTGQLAERWDLEERTIEAWRNRRTRRGPPYIKLPDGRVLYRQCDIVGYELRFRIVPRRA